MLSFILILLLTNASTTWVMLWFIRFAIQKKWDIYSFNIIIKTNILRKLQIIVLFITTTHKNFSKILNLFSTPLNDNAYLYTRYIGSLFKYSTLFTFINLQCSLIKNKVPIKRLEIDMEMELLINEVKFINSLYSLNFLISKYN